MTLMSGLKMPQNNVKQYPFESDIIIIPVNLSGGAWQDNYSGIKIIHIPSKMAFESTENVSDHANKARCYEALSQYLANKN